MNTSAHTPEEFIMDLIDNGVHEDQIDALISDMSVLIFEHERRQDAWPMCTTTEEEDHDYKFLAAIVEAWEGWVI